jgi:threonine dehydrogenase-like Zn-dependent dehydrogenase
VIAGLKRRPSAPVLVLGGLTHGVYATAVSAALGAERVTYVDTSARRRAMATSDGADAVSEMRDLVGNEFPVTVDAAGKPTGLDAALRATAPDGHCHSLSIYFDPVRVPFWHMYMNGVTLTTGRPDVTPYARAVLELIAAGTLDPIPAYSDGIEFADLPEALLELPPKPLIRY